MVPPVEKAGKRMEAKTLVDDTLGRKGGVAVEQHAHGGPVRRLVVVVVLYGPRLAQDDGILGFEVGGVGNQRELDALAGRSRPLEVHAQVILDVTRALVFGGRGTCEFTKYRLIWFPNDVAEHIQPPAVRHADDNVLDPVVDAAVDQSLHAGHQRLASLQAKALVVGVFGREEGLEAGAPDQAVEDAALLVDGVLERLGDLDPFAQPVALLAVGDVDEFDAVRAAVDLLARGDDFAQRHLLAALLLEPRQDAGAQCVFRVEVLVGKLVVVQRQLLGLDVAEPLGPVSDAQGVDVGLVMPAGLVCADEQLDLEMVRDLGALCEAETGAGGQARHSSGGAGNERWRRREGLRDGHVAALHVLEVDLPRHMDAGGVFLPLHVHLVDVVGRVTREEVVVGVGRRGHGARGSSLHRCRDGQRSAAGDELSGGSQSHSRQASRRGSRARRPLQRSTAGEA